LANGARLSIPAQSLLLVVLYKTLLLLEVVAVDTKFERLPFEEVVETRANTFFNEWCNSILYPIDLVLLFLDDGTMNTLSKKDNV